MCRVLVGSVYIVDEYLFESVAFQVPHLGARLTADDQIIFVECRIIW